MFGRFCPVWTQRSQTFAAIRRTSARYYPKWNIRIPKVLRCRPPRWWCRCADTCICTPVWLSRISNSWPTGTGCCTPRCTMSRRAPFFVRRSCNRTAIDDLGTTANDEYLGRRREWERTNTYKKTVIVDRKRQIGKYQTRLLMRRKGKMTTTTGQFQRINVHENRNRSSRTKRQTRANVGISYSWCYIKDRRWTTTVANE